MRPAFATPARRWLRRARLASRSHIGRAMDTSDLTLRDKIAIIDTTARLAAAMFLVLVLVCELILTVQG